MQQMQVDFTARQQPGEALHRGDRALRRRRDVDRHQDPAEMEVAIDLVDKAARAPGAERVVARAFLHVRLFVA